MNQYKDDNIEKYPLHIDILCIISAKQKTGDFLCKNRCRATQKSPFTIGKYKILKPYIVTGANRGLLQISVTKANISYLLICILNLSKSPN